MAEHIAMINCFWWTKWDTYMTVDEHISHFPMTLVSVEWVSWWYQSIAFWTTWHWFLCCHVPCSMLATPAAFMNSAYRKACYQKAMAHNRYVKMGKTQLLWQKYRKARNYAAKLRATSVKNFFETRCNSQFTENPKRYWDTIKPFMTD